MAITLNVTLGTVNFNDYLHVTAAKVSAPGSVVWETWIYVPVSSYNFVIPGLDPEIYYISYYDAPTNTAMGTLVMQLQVNALTGEFVTERRFYKVGSGIGNAPDDGDLSLVDNYLIYKNVTGYFKQGNTYLEPGTEYTFDTITGTITLLTDVFNMDERIVVEITYAVGSVAGSGNPYYNGNIDVTAATYTVLTTNKRKRHRLVGTAPTQVLTLPSLAGLSADDFYIFDNKCGGMAVQVKLLTNGSDSLTYNGFGLPSNDFAEFWVSQGESLTLAKAGSQWELINDFYPGVNVGRYVTGGLYTQPGLLPRDGAIVYDGEEYPRLWWYLKNLLPNTHYVEDANVTNPGYTNPTASKQGLWVLHPTLKKFRTGNWQGLHERGLKDFDSYGGDTDRPYDYPSGFQADAVLSHGHTISTSNSGASSSDTTDPVRSSQVGSVSTRGSAGAGKTIGLTGASENRVKNAGVIYFVQI